MPSISTKWRYSLVNTNENKRAVRTATPKGLAWDQIGMDGSADGGKRPHPGLKMYKELTGNLGTVAQGLEGFFPVTFRASATAYAYGFVYRVKNDSSNSCKYFLEYRVGTSTTWVGPVDLVGTRTDGDKQMNVTIFGRFVYVFVSGSEPFYFYLNESSPGVFTLVVVEDTGPGLPPEVFTQPFHVAATDLDVPVALDTTTFFATVPTSGRARFINWVFFPTGVTWGGSPPAAGQNWNQQGGLSVPNVGAVLTGPIDVDASCTQDSPTLYDWGTGSSPEGVQYLGNGGASDAPTPIVLSTVTASSTYAYAYAYVLYDSRTGIKSAPSEKYLFYYNHQSFLLSPWIVNSGTADEQVGWSSIDVLYDPLRYDTILMYRSPAISFDPSTDPVPDSDQFLLKLDSIRTLADYDFPTPTPPTGFSRSLIFYHLSNAEIIVQEDLAQDTYLEDMPTGGSSIFYEKTMLVGKSGTLNSDVGGLGVFNWSSLNELSVELFRASDRYLMTLPDEEVERFLLLGPNVLAMTKQGIYLVRRENRFIKAFPIHQGFGVTGPRAACTVGSEVYYLTGQGLKVMDAQGTLSDVDAVNNIIQKQWATTLSQVEIAFDATYKTLVVLNPALEHVILFWMQTGQVTELFDCPFRHVTDGNVTYAEATSGSPLEPRACFVQEIESSGSYTGYGWRVYTQDYGRQKNMPTLLDYTGPVIFSTDRTFSSGTTFTTNTMGFGSRLEGCKLYVLEGPLAGQKATIQRRVSGQTVELSASDAANLYGLESGVRVGISPVYFRWVGCQLGIETDAGVQFMETYDYFETRHADSLGCVFVDVEDNGLGGTQYKDLRYRALLYAGTQETPVVQVFPVNEDSTKVESIVMGTSPNDVAFTDVTSSSIGRYGYAGKSVFPGVEIFVPGIDYRLLQVKVEGKIMPEEASGVN